MKYSFTFFTLLLTTLIFGQTQKVSLKKCLDYALENSHKTNQAKLDLENNEYVLRENFAAVLPKLNAKTTYTRNIGLPTRILSGNFLGVGTQRIPISFGADNNVDFGLKLNQVAFNASLFSGRKLAEPSRELFRQLLQHSEEEIIYDVAQQYYGILKYEEQKKVIEINLERLGRLLDLVKLQVENDFGKPTDIKNIELKIADLKVLEIQLNAGMEIQYKALKLLMGMDLHQEIQIADFTPTATLPADMNAPKPTEITNLQLLASQKTIRQLEQSIIKKEALPTLGLFAFLGGQFQDDALDVSNGDNWNSVTHAGVDLKIPILDGKKRKSQVQQLDVTLQKLDNDYKQAAAYTQFEFEKTIAELKSQLAILNAQNQKIELLKELYNQTLLQYRENSSSMVELLNAEADLRQAELTYSAQLFDYQLIILNYLKAKGALKGLN